MSPDISETWRVVPTVPLDRRTGAQHVRIILDDPRGWGALDG